jgi:hypothetical protein
MIPGVSAGSKKVEASEKCTAQVIWPTGASARPSGVAAAGHEAIIISRTERRTLERRTGFVIIGLLTS